MRRVLFFFLILFAFFKLNLSFAGSLSSVVTIEEKLPCKGKRLAAIEIGAQGFNYFIIEVDKNLHWDLVKAKYGVSLIREGVIPTKELKAIFLQHLEDIFEYGVSPRNVHFVISSGALSSKYGEIVAENFRKMGFIVNKITPRLEAIYGFIASVPEKFRENSFFVDIGSGNTKVAWLQDGKFKTFSTYGSKYYLSGVSDTEVYKTVKSLFEQIPQKNRRFCFIIGGVPYKLAKIARTSEKEDFTPLLPPADYGHLIDQKKRKIHSGLIIYKAIVDATGTSVFIFPWKASFPIGFLLSLEKAHLKQ